jgi:hypothetical protein
MKSAKEIAVAIEADGTLRVRLAAPGQDLSAR